MFFKFKMALAEKMAKAIGQEEKVQDMKEIQSLMGKKLTSSEFDRIIELLVKNKESFLARRKAN